MSEDRELRREILFQVLPLGVDDPVTLAERCYRFVIGKGHGEGPGYSSGDAGSPGIPRDSDVAAGPPDEEEDPGSFSAKDPEPAPPGDDTEEVSIPEPLWSNERPSVQNTMRAIHEICQHSPDLGWCTTRALAKMLSLKQQTATVRVFNLKRKGLIERKGHKFRPVYPGAGGPKPEPTAKTPAAIPASPQRRIATPKPTLEPESVEGLPDDHPAVQESRTLFPTTVVDVADAPRLLVSGENSRKTGKFVTKGPWTGYPIYTLTLEERATCPRSCFHWQTCYGNGMPKARRHKHGQALIDRLAIEIEDLQEQHPKGFVVRLHILGDFYDMDYVQAWGRWLDKFPALHVFGYTAWQPVTNIGFAVSRLAQKRWDRFAVRVSAQGPHPGGATTIWREPEADVVKEGHVCPAQTGKTECCGTCGMCWSEALRNETIVFVAHGRKSKSGAAAAQETTRPKRIARAVTPPPPPTIPGWLQSAIDWLDGQHHRVVPVANKSGLFTIMNIPGEHTAQSLMRTANNLRARRGLPALPVPDLDPPVSEHVKSQLGATSEGML